MTATDEAPISRDGKAGICMNCRKGSHVLCTSPTCTCWSAPAPHFHPNRSTEKKEKTVSAPSPIRQSQETDDHPVLAWENPPPVRAGKSSLEPGVFATVKARPGDWARVKEYASASGAYTAAKKIKAGAYGPGFEAAPRKN